MHKPRFGKGGMHNVSAVRHCVPACTTLLIKHVRCSQCHAANPALFWRSSSTILVLTRVLLTCSASRHRLKHTRFGVISKEQTLALQSAPRK